METSIINSGVSRQAGRFRTGVRHAAWGGEPPPVLVVGTGALARATREDIELGGRRVLGYLAWEGEQPSSPLRAPNLGTVARLADVLAEHQIGEVFLAASRNDLDELDDAVRTCEDRHVRFAVPATPFRLTRGRARGTGSFPDGYIHFRADAEPAFHLFFAQFARAALQACRRRLAAPALMVWRRIAARPPRGARAIAAT